jgi:hypothetical protein
VLGTVQPGQKLALPYGFDAAGKQLLVRAALDYSTEPQSTSTG